MMLCTCTCTCRFLADNPNTEWIQKSEGHKGVKASQVQGHVKRAFQLITRCSSPSLQVIDAHSGEAHNTTTNLLVQELIRPLPIAG